MYQARGAARDDECKTSQHVSWGQQYATSRRQDESVQLMSSAPPPRPTSSRSSSSLIGDHGHLKGALTGPARGGEVLLGNPPGEGPHLWPLLDGGDLGQPPLLIELGPFKRAWVLCHVIRVVARVTVKRHIRCCHLLSGWMGGWRGTKPGGIVG